MLSINKWQKLYKCKHIKYNYNNIKIRNIIIKINKINGIKRKIWVIIMVKI